MTEHHPLTEKILDAYDTDAPIVDALDRTIREYLAPKQAQAEVRFPGTLAENVRVEATFIESGTQLQQIFIGTEPVLVVQPEYDAETDTVTMITTAVDCDVFSLPEVLGFLLDGANEMAKQAEQMRDDERRMVEEADELAPWEDATWD